MTDDNLRTAFESWALNTPPDERTNWEVFQAGARAAAQSPAEGALTDDRIEALVYEQCPTFDDAHEGPSMDDVLAIVRAALSASKAQPKGTAKCNCTAYCGQYLMHGSCPAYPAAVTVVPAPAPLTSVCHMECGGCIDAGKCAFPGKPAEPARYPHPDEDDAVTLWAEIHRLRAAVQGPDGYATWQEAATAERVRRVAAEKALAATQAPAPGADDMLEPLIYAAIMHNGKPKTVAEFERAAANVADMLQRRAEVTHNKPVASIYISDDGSREFDDWRVDLPPGNHQLFTAPRPDQPQPESLPHPGAPEAEEMIEKLLAECNRPSNMKNAARAGYMAAKRLLQNARQPLPAVEDAEPIGWGGVIETCAELCDPHFIAQQDLAELKRYAGNWNSTYRFFPIYAPNTQCAAVADGKVMVPREPTPGLLMSMAIRHDHGLGLPGYYDSPMFLKMGHGATHAQRLESTLGTMRQLYEEATGQGFYAPEREGYYVALKEAKPPVQRSGK